ncbi:MAG: ABC transporter substrate-binding protein [Terriglobia bacterium]
MAANHRVPPALAFLCALCVSAVNSSHPATSHGPQATSHEPTPAEGLRPAGGSLIYGAGLIVRGLNPLLDRNGWNELSSALLSRLFRVDHTGQIVGDLVEDYRVSDDGLTYTLRLRPDLRWHDGAPCTADDILFTWQKLFDPATATSLDLNLPMLRSFEKKTPREFVFHLRYPAAGFLAPLTEIPILPAHILRDTDINSDAFDRNPIGTGPYKLVSRSESSEFVLARHADYHFGPPPEGSGPQGGPPPIARLILRVIPDDDARAAALARGELHLTQVKPQHVARLRALPHLRLHRMRTGVWRGMPLNLRRPALQDVRVRRAIDLAIDREAIVAGALAGFGTPAYSPIPPASWAFDPALTRRRYPPDEAARLLDAAGWKQNAAGWRVRQGQVLELNVIVWQDELFRRTAAELIRQQLAPLGIRVILHRVDSATYTRLADHMGTTYDTFIGGWSGLLDPGDNLGKKFHSRGSQNYSGYNNPDVDRLLARVRVRARTPQQRDTVRQLYRRLVARLTADAVFLPLAYPDYVFAADARLADLDEFVCDSWYQFTQFAHEWRWQASDPRPATGDP